MLDERAGVFVSLKKRGKLRGCIGTIAARKGNVLADEIINNAVSAGTEDPRFAPVSRIELEELTYSVDVLGKAQPVESAEEPRYETFWSHRNERRTPGGCCCLTLKG